MGLPVSRFKMLAELCSNETCVQNSFNVYKLVCIVIHDPEDRDFTRKMQHSFSLLHEQTGKDMLFISFVRPPLGWKQSLGIDKDQIKININESGIDSWLIINHFLPIVAPDSNVPCILITHDLLSREYIILESDINDFERQLISLGQYCTSSEGRFTVEDPRFQEFVSTLGSPHLQALPRRSIAEELAGTLALYELRNRDNREEARKWTDRRFSELKVEKDYALAYEEDDYSALYQYDSYASDLEKMRHPRTFIIDVDEDKLKKYHIREMSIRGYDLCDVRSRGDIQRFNRYLPFFSILGLQELAGPLTYFFERELNRTLVQQMRMHMGIEMPEYYRKFKKNFDAQIRTKKVVIGLNACKFPDRLKSVMTGKAFYAYLAMCDERGPYRMKDLMGRSFMDEWANLILSRNDAHHAKENDEDFGHKEFNAFFNSFSAMLRDHLWKMEEIGEALRKGNELPLFPEQGNLFERGGFFPFDTLTFES